MQGQLSSGPIYLIDIVRIINVDVVYEGKFWQDENRPCQVKLCSKPLEVKVSHKSFFRSKWEVLHANPNSGNAGETDSQTQQKYTTKKEGLPHT